MTNQHARKDEIRRTQRRTGAPYTSVAAATAHDHSGAVRTFCPPNMGAPFASKTECEWVVRLYEAALQGCRPCREALLTQVATTSSATVGLVSWALGITSELFCDIPEQVTDNKALSAPWRTLARAWQRSHSPRTMTRPCSALNADRRREAASDAVDLAVALNHHWRDRRPAGDTRYCTLCEDDDRGTPQDSVWLDYERVDDPVLALANRVHLKTGGGSLNTSADLYRQVRSLVIASLPGGPSDYGAYRDTLEDFAIREGERLCAVLKPPRDLYGDTEYRAQLRAHPMSVALLERLDAGADLSRHQLPGDTLLDLAERWACSQRNR